MANYIVKAVIHFPDGINEGQVKVSANSDQEAIDEAVEKLKRIWSVADHSITIKSASRQGVRMADETTEETEGPVKEKTSMDDQSKEIKKAGVEEEEEKTSPDPKAKTPEELAENPHDALDINEDATDPLSVDKPANGEMLESMKNANADGDTIIKKDGQDVKNGGGYYEDSPPAMEDKVKGKQGLSKNVDLDIFTKMSADGKDGI